MGEREACILEKKMILTLFVYSASQHDTRTLVGLNVAIPRVPEYCSYIIYVQALCRAAVKMVSIQRSRHTK